MAIIVIGGINQDIKAVPHAVLRPGTSNPGTVWMGPGGVGRNIAHTLAGCGIEVSLWSVIGDDSTGRELRESTRKAGINVDELLTAAGSRTGSYTAIQDREGELVAAVSDMQIMERISPDYLEERKETLGLADCLIADTNLPAASLQLLASLASDSGTPLLIEPVSTAKAARLMDLPLKADWITPNADELEVLCGVPAVELAAAADTAAAESAEGRPFSPVPIPVPTFTTQPCCDNILVTLGGRGVLLLSRDPGCIQLTARDYSAVKHPPGTRFLDRPAAFFPDQWKGWWFPPFPARIRDVNGAGDAFAAGFITALFHPALLWNTELAVLFAQAAAVLTLESDSSAPSGSTMLRIMQRLKNLGILEV
ncbi:MAG: carbohydrate kinase family protein [Spirochaetota bacterium]|nr:carbohydrate kinase family protein [Spirochaetota bacterium]